MNHLAHTSIEQLLSMREEIKTLINNNNIESAKEKVTRLEEGLQASETIDLNEKCQTLAVLATYYNKISNYDKAANLFINAVNIAKKTDQLDRNIVVDLYLDYAELEREYGQFQHARILLAKLLEILEKNHIEDAFVFGRTYRSLGNVYVGEENMVNGIRQLEKALDYFQQAVSDTHPVIAQTIHAISEAHLYVENYQQAINIYQPLLTSYKYEQNKLAEGRLLLKIGEIYFYINLKDARKTITEAITCFKEVYKEKHLDIAKANLMLAELDENMGSFKRALTYYKRALEQLRAFHHESHFMIVYVYSKIGMISMRAEEVDQAKYYLEKGLDLSTEFPKIRQQFLYGLGKIYSGEKDYGQARNVFQEFLQQLENNEQTKTKMYANTLQALAFNELEQEQFESGMRLYDEARSIYEQLSPDASEEKGFTYIRLAYCYENMNNLKKAEEYYEKGFQTLEKLRDPAILEEALAGIIDFFTRYNQPKKRKKYEDKLVKLQNGSL